MSNIYISGAIRGLSTAQAVYKFNVAAQYLKHRGYNPMMPFTLTLGHISNEHWQYFRKKDIKKLMDCSLIALLPDWENCQDCQLDLHLSLATGISTFFLPTNIYGK